ncbi:MAG: bifunctional 5,10-methylene-tetrahydrofolate dehydrogenase/5,10-methylene-tetrahydrofolate cyclohydrolase [candidate division Zixibacteria bacterium]|nr:bifunctional 5,10-methylene-tetrahydrofolate dehydrogenase/5,10-methylene-tetrahydrofolate cyclohydrolase [candidate division Zixibacteria bacterium]
MTAEIIDGKKIASEVKKELKGRIGKLIDSGIEPSLIAVLVGDDPVSKQYVNMKHKACAKLGIKSRIVTLPESTSESKLLDLIGYFNQDNTVHGILVQLPLPDHINQLKINLAVDVNKDVDGFHPANLGKMLLGKPSFIPATPLGIMELLNRSGNNPEGKHTVILGRGELVGRPLSVLISLKSNGANSTVTLCHSGTKELGHFTKQADILVCAMGRAEMISADMIKPGAVVIDSGTTAVDDSTSEKGYRIAGDVDFESASEVAGYITPVPGGVGPMTIAMLLANTVSAAEKLAGKSDER